jgi:formyl-CoA transferase
VKPFEGIKVVEAATYIFVPTATAVLADLGADVVKIEPPGGDPMRRGAEMMSAGGDRPATATSLGCLFELANRGKRSVTLDLASPAARPAFEALVAGADVFATNFLPGVRSKLRLGLDDIRALNPSVIYASGSGWGPKGPMRETAAFDMTSAWAQSGAAEWFTRASGGEPPQQPFGFYDVPAGSSLAGAIAMALFQRERTGVAPDVDVSLLNVGWWAMEAEIGPAGVAPPTVPVDRREPANPLVSWYGTADDRWLVLSMAADGDRWWRELCARLERPELASDERFASSAGRSVNNRACAADLEATFRRHTLAEWRERFEGFGGAWGPFLDAREVHDHPQAAANGFLHTIVAHDGVPVSAVAPPVQLGGEPTRPAGRAPTAGEHTAAVLAEIGFATDGNGQSSGTSV